MIEKLIIFENSGICLFSKVYSGTYSNNDDLATGFLAAMFGYINTEFGKIECIYTEKKILLICNIQGFFIVLIVTQFPQTPQNSEDQEKMWIFNKRLENTCKSQLALLERRVGTTFLQLKLRQVQEYNYKTIFEEMEQDMDNLISIGMRKIELLEQLFIRGDSHTPLSEVPRLYKY